MWHAWLQLGFYRSPVFTEAFAAIISIDVLIWLVFVADVLINFRTSFYDEDHQIVLDPKKVARSYRDGWFAYDLIATLPYHLLGGFSTLAASSSARTLVVATCKIPICLRLGACRVPRRPIPTHCSPHAPPRPLARPPAADDDVLRCAHGAARRPLTSADERSRPPGIRLASAHVICWHPAVCWHPAAHSPPRQQDR